MATLQSCGPCDCAKNGGRDVYNITAAPIQKWLPQANSAGKSYEMNPAIFLAIASVETNGNYAAVSGGSYGIVQIDQNHLNGYNCHWGSTYKLTDLVAQGPNVYTAEEAVLLSFRILGDYMQTMNAATASFKLTATGWNGAMCGYSGSVQPYGGTACGTWPIPTASSCYGEAVYKLASAYSAYWIDPSTGKANSWYFADLPAVSSNPLPLYNKVCYGL